MSARSPVRDRRVIVLAAEVAETRDRKVPGVLLGLKCKRTCHILLDKMGGVLKMHLVNWISWILLSFRQ